MSVNFLISLEIFQFGLQIPHAPCIKQVSERKIGIVFFLYFYVLKKTSKGKRGIYLFCTFYVYQTASEQLLRVKIVWLKGLVEGQEYGKFLT